MAYGSYYRLQNRQDFQPVLDTALALKAPLIRVWAGTIPSAAASPAYYHDAARELADICEAAAAHGMSIGLEYHRNTLTDTWESTDRLLSLAGKENLYTYWQMNPELTFAQRLEEITRLRSRICCVHTFFWGQDNGRLPLTEGIEEFREYLALLGDNRCPFVFEFVKDDSEAQLNRDAETLRELLKRTE